MLKQCLVIALGLIGANVALATEKNIGAGEEWVIAESENNLVLDSLSLGDGAVVRFADGVESWTIKASHVDIGSNVFIDARGRKGISGEGAAIEYESAADACKDGKPGHAGLPGGQGGKGVDLVLSWGIVSLGSLKIATDGGKGGSGGKGGTGQSGGGIDRCRGGNGGIGGAGGLGGQGGNAGALTFVYWPVAEELDTASIIQNIQYSAKAGYGGEGGQGGNGGAAVEGRYMKGSFAGNKKWLAGGEPGKSGAAGVAGKEGRSAVPVVQADIAKGAISFAGSKALPKKAAAGTVNLEQRIDVLEKQLHRLERRLEQLEKAVR